MFGNGAGIGTIVIHLKVNQIRVDQLQVQLVFGMGGATSAALSVSASLIVLTAILTQKSTRLDSVLSEDK